MAYASIIRPDISNYFCFSGNRICSKSALWKAGLYLWQVLHSLTFFLRQIEINELQPPETQTIHGLLLLLGLWTKLLFPGEDHVLRTLS